MPLVYMLNINILHVGQMATGKQFTVTWLDWDGVNLNGLLLPWNRIYMKISQGIYLCFLIGGIKCPVCSFVYGTKWEFNRHLKNKHGMKLVENDGETKWEVKQNINGFDTKFFLNSGEKSKDKNKKCTKMWFWLYIRSEGHGILSSFECIPCYVC